jgi:hypothetical protein
MKGSADEFLSLRIAIYRFSNEVIDRAHIGS